MTPEMSIKHKRRNASIRRYIPLFIMMTPALLYFFINNYLPMFGIIIAFKDINISKGFLGSDWIGFRNFEYLFKTEDAFVITRNTILYNTTFIFLNIIFQVGIAILLNEIRQRFLTRLYQSLIILPALISWVVASYFTYALLSSETGMLNNTILPALGLNIVSWYSEAKFWPFILTFVQIWKMTGYGCVIYFASIISISPDYYKAARLDGAKKLQQIRYITLPHLKPVIIMMTILAIGKMFYTDFGLFYQIPMDSGVLYDTTNTIDTYVYRGLLKLGDIGMSSAAGAYQSIVGFFLVLISNFVVRKIDKDYALF